MQKIDILITEASEIIINQYKPPKWQPHFWTILGNFHKNELIHSQILSDLLNPFGSHAKGNIFLQDFLKIVGISGAKYSDMAIEIEKNVTTNGTDGRIDIYLEGKMNVIVIENKIYAPDQMAQVWRYWEYAKAQNKDFHVFYLTLNGHEPSFESRKTLLPHVDFTLISYQKHILKWLGNVIETNGLNPEYHVFIQNYISLIKQLAGTMENQEIKEELTNYLSKKSDADFDAIEKLAQAHLTLKKDILRNLWHQIEQKLKEKGFEPIWKNANGHKSFEKAIDGNFHYRNRSDRKPFGLDIYLKKVASEGQEFDVFFRIQTEIKENRNGLVYGIWIRYSGHEGKRIDETPSFSDGIKDKNKYANIPITQNLHTIFKEEAQKGYSLKTYHYQWSFLIQTDLHFDKLSEKNIQLFATNQIQPKMETWLNNLVEILVKCKES